MRLQSPGRLTDLWLSIQRHIKASPSAVHDAWLDPVTIARFMAGAVDQRVKDATTAPCVGGTFRIGMTSGKEIAHQGVYKDRAPHSVIFDKAENRLNAQNAIMRRAPEGLITR